MAFKLPSSASKMEHRIGQTRYAELFAAIGKHSRRINCRAEKCLAMEFAHKYTAIQQ